MRDYGPGNPLIFNHIPKCAGNSLRAALASTLQPTLQTYQVDLALVGAHRDFDAVTGAERERFAFTPDDLHGAADFVTGHISPGTTMARFPGADHVTTLRDPRQRLISQWMHSRSLSDFDLRHWGPGAAAFRVARGSLAEYLEHAPLAPNVDNTITRFLTWPHPMLAQDRFIDPADDAALLSAALERLDAFLYVGVVENKAFVDDLATVLGRSLETSRLNERASVPPKARPHMAAELTPQTVALLEHRCRIDLQIWVRVAERTFDDPQTVLSDAWTAALDRWASMLDEPDTRPRLRRVAESAYGLRTRLVGHHR